jgi:uncharacterized protein VirK/YbjX
MLDVSKEGKSRKLLQYMNFNKSTYVVYQVRSRSRIVLRPWLYPNALSLFKHIISKSSQITAYLVGEKFSQLLLKYPKTPLYCTSTYMSISTRDDVGHEMQKKSSAVFI